MAWNALLFFCSLMSCTIYERSLQLLPGGSEQRLRECGQLFGWAELPSLFCGMVLGDLGNSGATPVKLFASDGDHEGCTSILWSSTVHNLHGPIWGGFNKAIAVVVPVVKSYSTWMWTSWRRRWSPGYTRWGSFHWLQGPFGAVSDLHTGFWPCSCSNVPIWVEHVDSLM